MCFSRPGREARGPPQRAPDIPPDARGGPGRRGRSSPAHAPRGTGHGSGRAEVRGTGPRASRLLPGWLGLGGGTRHGAAPGEAAP